MSLPLAIQENTLALATAKISLEEALVLEDMEGLPLDEAKMVLHGVQSNLAAAGVPVEGKPLEPSNDQGQQMQYLVYLTG